MRAGIDAISVSIDLVERPSKLIAAAERRRLLESARSWRRGLSHYHVCTFESGELFALDQLKRCAPVNQARETGTSMIASLGGSRLLDRRTVSAAPVETCVILWVGPKRRKAAMESPQPTIVVPGVIAIA